MDYKGISFLDYLCSCYYKLPVHADIIMNSDAAVMWTTIAAAIINYQYSTYQGLQQQQSAVITKLDFQAAFIIDQCSSLH
jgi:hypothetical protein